MLTRAVGTTRRSRHSLIPPDRRRTQIWRNDQDLESVREADWSKNVIRTEYFEKALSMLFLSRPANRPRYWARSGVPIRTVAQPTLASSMAEFNSECLSRRDAVRIDIAYSAVSERDGPLQHVASLRLSRCFAFLVQCAARLLTGKQNTLSRTWQELRVFHHSRPPSRAREAYHRCPTL